MTNTTKHKIDDHLAIVSEDYVWLDNEGHSHHEMITYLEKDNIAWQDICMVKYIEGKDGSNPHIETCVWADCNSEDYTHKFNIGIYKDED